MKINELRAIMRRQYGKRNYRITKDGQVHVYGTIPNTDIRGWWHLGYLNDENLIITL